MPFEFGDLLCAEGELDTGDGILEVAGADGADDRGGYRRLPGDPGEGDLRAGSSRRSRRSRYRTS